MRRAFRNVAYNLAGQASPMIVALVALPILTRQVGLDRLGFLGLAWALIGYFALLDFGLARVVTRRVALAVTDGTLRTEVDAVRRLARRLFLVVVAVSALLAWSIPPRWIIGDAASAALSREASIALPILWATVPATVATGLLRGTLEGMQAFARVNALRSLFGIWSFAAPLAVLPFSTTLPALTLAIAVGRYLSLWAHARAVATSTARRDPLGSSARIDTSPRTTKSLWSEGAWLSVSNLVGPLMVTFDRLAIARIVSIAAAGYYFVPQEMALRLLFLPAAVSATIFPMLAGALHEPTRRVRISRGALLAVAVVSLPACLALALLAGPLMRIWMGPAFEIESAPVATLIAVGLFANCCAQIPFAWIQAAGRADVTGKLHLLQLPVYCVLVYLATSRFGIVGAAVVWSLRAIVDYVLLLIASKKLFTHLHDALSAIVIDSAFGIAALACLAAIRLTDAGPSYTAVIATFGIAVVLRMGWRLYGDIRG